MHVHYVQKTWTAHFACSTHLSRPQYRQLCLYFWCEVAYRQRTSNLFSLSMHVSIWRLSRIKAEEISQHFGNILYGARLALTEFYTILANLSSHTKNCPWKTDYVLWTIRNFHLHYYKGIRWTVPHEIKGLILNNKARWGKKKRE